MEDGYGLAGIDDPTVTAKLRNACPSRPRTIRPTWPPPAPTPSWRSPPRPARRSTWRRAPPTNNTQTGQVHNAPSSADGGSSNSTAIVLIAGGSVGLLVALVGLFWWVRRAPEDDAAPDAG